MLESVERNALIEMALARPNRNLDGMLGPQHYWCSGLGQVLKPKVGYGDGPAQVGVLRETSRCSCLGTGIDLPALDRHDHELMWRRIHEIESRMDLPLTSRYKLPTIINSRQYWMELISWVTADGTAIASSTTETIIFPNVTIPAGYMQDGRMLRLRAQGKYSTLGSGTVTHVYKVRWGGVAGTVLCTTGTVTLLISMTNAYFDMDVTIQTRSNGSSGTLLADGLSRTFGGTAPTIGSATGAPAISPMTAGGQTAPATATCDLTADTALSITLTHGANSASNTATGMHYSIESLN